MSDDPEEYHNEDDNDPTHPESRDFFCWIMIELEQAASAEVFHRAIGRALRHAHTLEADQLEEIADAVSQPWSGRKTQAARHRSMLNRIFLSYVMTANGSTARGEPSTSTAEAARKIMEDVERDRKEGLRPSLGGMDKRRIEDLYRKAMKEGFQANKKNSSRK